MRARRRAAPTTARVRPLEPAELAWIAAVPCALLTLAALLALGAPLGRLLLTPRRHALWRSIDALPQPAQHGRVLVALLGPPLLAAVVLAPVRRPALRPSTTRVLVRRAQLTLVAFLLLCLAAQNDVLLSADFVFWPHRAYFSPVTLAVAAALPALALALLRGRALRLPRETRARRRACLLLAALCTGLWLTTAIDLDSSVGNTIGAVIGHLLWTLAEPFAVLDGRTPLVDYHAQYGQLWAYLAAVPMALFGASVGTYTATMAAGTGLAVLAVYALLRRLVGSSLLALALYLPFLATAFVTIVGPASDRYGPQNIFILWPIRYGGPMLLAWLAGRMLDGAPPRRPWVVFAAAGLAVLNNPDFGLAAALATFAALASARWREGAGAIGRLAAEALAGAAGAVALFALCTLVRAGAPPRFGLLFEFGRLYGIDGWEQLPMPALGLHVAIFVTFAAALTVAAVRVARDEAGAPLTGMLAWIGVFGLVASVYFAGRAHTLALYDFFAPWALAVLLLALVVVPALAARGWRRPTGPQLAVLFACGLLVCSLPQTPTPWSQLARIRDRTPTPAFEQRAAVRLVAATATPGEHVGILTTLGHRVAYDAHVVNVSPYSSVESIAGPAQLATTLAALRRAGVRKLYLDMRFMRGEQLAVLATAGWVARRAAGDGYRLLVQER